MTGGNLVKGRKTFDRGKNVVKVMRILAGGEIACGVPRLSAGIVPNSKESIFG